MKFIETSKSNFCDSWDSFRSPKHLLANNFMDVIILRKQATRSYVLDGSEMSDKGTRYAMYMTNSISKV
jgi:hypothetical protein